MQTASMTVRASLITAQPKVYLLISQDRECFGWGWWRLQQDVPAHKALHCHVDLSLGRPPNDQWKRRPGRPRERQIDQVRKDNGIPPGGSVEACDESWSPRNNATALAGFAIPTTTMEGWLHNNVLDYRAILYCPVIGYPTNRSHQWALRLRSPI